MIKKNTSINLLRSRDQGYLAKFLDWALTVGRVLVLLTEGVALSMFLYRFSLDTKIVDLHDQIKQKQSLIVYLKKSEDTYRSLQNRLSEARKINTVSAKTATIVDEAVQRAKGKLIISSVLYKDTGVEISGKTTSVSLVTSYIQSLKDYSEIENVSLDTISNDSTKSEITVIITAVFKGAAPVAEASPVDASPPVNE